MSFEQAAQEEAVTIDFAFASVVTIKRVRKGEAFTEENFEPDNAVQLRDIILRLGAEEY